MLNIDIKNVLLADYCDPSTMFICLCETFLHEGILNSEVQITGFIIARSDRVYNNNNIQYLYSAL